MTIVSVFCWFFASQLVEVSAGPPNFQCTEMLRDFKICDKFNCSIYYVCQKSMRVDNANGSIADDNNNGDRNQFTWNNSISKTNGLTEPHYYWQEYHCTGLQPFFDCKIRTCSSSNENCGSNRNVDECTYGECVPDINNCRFFYMCIGNSLWKRFKCMDEKPYFNHVTSVCSDKNEFCVKRNVFLLN